MKQFLNPGKFLLLIFGLLLILWGWGLSQSSTPKKFTSPFPFALPLLPQPAPGTQTFKVSRVIDGDTIEIFRGAKLIKVRYLGIEAPEMVHPEKEVECFARQATEENKKLTEGKEVKLEKDVSETDRYGRLLRYVWERDIFLNDYLVRNGFAHAVSFPPDVKYQEQLQGAEKEARENQRGLWAEGICEVISTTTSNQDECLIKGNISSSGEKIYHLPGQRYYEKTIINEAVGERWFCREEEAISAGWRKAKI